jgi:hypothetical protein
MAERITEYLTTTPDLQVCAAAAVSMSRLPSQSDFRVVPRVCVNSPEGMLWRIVLSPYLDELPLLPLEIRGDVVVGLRTQETPTVDVDLKKWNGYYLGVSRRHVCLRPTWKRLYIFDLSSTNGTYLNGVLLGPSRALALADGDVLTLGHMHIGVSLLARPHMDMVPQ